MNVYLVTKKLAERWWAIEVPELPGVFTQARIGHNEVEEMARDAIAITLNVDPQSFDIRIEELA